MDFTILLYVAASYLLGFPLLFRLVCAGHTQFFIKRKLANVPPAQRAKMDMPTPLWAKLKPRFSFTFKDSRPHISKAKEKKFKKAEVQYKKDVEAWNKAADAGQTPPGAQPPVKPELKPGMNHNKKFFLIWGMGLAIVILAAVTGRWAWYPLAFLPFFAALVFSSSTAKPILQAREDLFRKMFEIGKATLQISAEHAANPQAVVQVLEWREILKPSKIRYHFPTTFNADSSENFMRQFNQVFGTETTWVPFHDEESESRGWDFEQGVLTLKETPPLPTMAPWSEHYVLDPSVAWSFFPIALGVEDGIELTNPETGLVENVLGFDVAGKQADLSKSMGTYCSPNITTSPMALCAGGTGGGKSVSQRNIILGCVLRPDSWRFLGIDLKKVELSTWRAYSNVVLGIATTIEDALTVLRFAQQTMMKRYAELETLGLNNFLDLPEKGQALLVMVDEAGELLSPSGVKALAASTPIPTPTGMTTMGALQVGDEVLDIYGHATVVKDKYMPSAQQAYELTITKDATQETEAVVAGEEHYWVAYFQSTDGSISGPKLMDTKELYAFKVAQAALPEAERTQVKFKRYRGESSLA